MRSRVSRGFARLALLLSGPMLMVAAACAGSEAYRASPQHEADFTIALVLIGLAALVYGLTRGIAWVIDGFVSLPEAHA